jgi:hypothetical protein
MQKKRIAVKLNFGRGGDGPPTISPEIHWNLLLTWMHESYSHPKNWSATDHSAPSRGRRTAKMTTVKTTGTLHNNWHQSQFCRKTINVGLVCAYPQCSCECHAIGR